MVAAKDSVLIGTFQVTGTKYVDMLLTAEAVTAKLLDGTEFVYVVTLEIISAGVQHLFGMEFVGQVTIRRV